MSDTPPPPSVPAGWLDDPDQPDTLRYWNGSEWTEDRAPKPPAPTPTPSNSGRHRPQSMRGGQQKPVPTSVAIDGWVDVKLSTVPSVAIMKTKGNWHKAHASAHEGTLTITTPSGATVASFAPGTYTPMFTMGFRQERKTPTWAIIVGVIGLLVFLLGALFFLVKETRQIETRILTVTLADGTSFSGPYMDGADYKK
jgi:hypothetical protein